MFRNVSLQRFIMSGLNSDPPISRSKLCAALESHPNLRVLELKNLFQMTLSDVAMLVLAPNLVVLRVVNCGLTER